MENYQELLQIYEELVITYDSLKKREDRIWLKYIRTFGELIEKSYLANIECIKLRKMISYCQTMKNAGREIKREQMENFVEIELADYYDELENIRCISESPCSEISFCEYEKIKKTYRNIVFMIHPDINGGEMSAQLFTLWEKAKRAYNNNDYDALIALYVLISKEMGGESKRDNEVIEDIEQRILKTRELIANVIYSEPYVYKEILEDKEKIKAKEQMLNEEIEYYEGYAKQLKEKLDSFSIEEM
jgi:hypothetical protein